MSYHDDHRVLARNRWYSSFDEARMTATVEIFDPSEEVGALDPDFNPEEHDEATVKVPVYFEVCGTCDGKGSHVNPSIDSHGLGREDFDEDPDFAEHYFSGGYDVPCYGCAGKRVVPVLDRARANPALVKALDKQAEDDAEYAAECAAERRMGC
jgi:hypothetical protein